MTLMHLDRQAKQRLAPSTLQNPYSYLSSECSRTFRAGKLGAVLINSGWQESPRILFMERLSDSEVVQGDTLFHWRASPMGDSAGPEVFKMHR